MPLGRLGGPRHDRDFPAVPDPPPAPYNAGVTPTFFAAVRPARPLLLGLSLAVALVAGGCEEPETVRKYDTPRVSPRAKAVDAERVRGLLDHMFAAVVPAKDTAWFFKLVVPAIDADALREPFDEFLATVDAKPGDKLPSWELPEGWTAEEGGAAMRAATITIPYGSGVRYELTVSKLPLQGDWTAYLCENVNRWMGQLEQPPLDADKITELARKVATKSEPATAFELVGTMQESPMGMMGAAGMPAGHPPVDGAAPATSAAPSESAAVTPRAISPSTGSAGVAPGRGDGFTYDLPAGWTLVAGSSMRKASFGIAAGGGKAEAAVFVFPPVGEMADPEANASRWAGMVGRTNLTPDELKAAESKVKFGDIDGTRYAFYSPADAPDAQGIIAALAVKGDQVWSMRLQGDKAAVESQSEAFNQFLESIRFDAQ
jgi:hypothetical protein